MAKVDGGNSSNISLVKEYFKELGISQEVSSSDVASIFDIADSDNDGSVDESAFIDAVESYFNVENLDNTDNYSTDTWETFAGSDGNSDSLSFSDISAMNSNTGTALSNSNSNGSSSNASASNSSTNTNTNTAQSNYSAATITGSESLSELQSKRSEVLSDLNEARTNKNSVQSNEVYTSAKNTVETTKQAYDDALNDLEEQENDEDGPIAQLNNEKEAKEDEISKQNEVISGLNDSITSQNTLISSINSSLSSLTEPNMSDYAKTTTDENGNTTTEYPGYEEAKAAYEAQKQDLEAQLIEAEDVLSQLEQQLSAAETTLTQLESDAADIDLRIQETTSELAEQGNVAAQQVETALNNYNAAQKALEAAEQELSAQADADIAQLESNLSAYETAIQTAEAQEAKESEEENNDNFDISKYEQETDTAQAEEDALNSALSDIKQELERQRDEIETKADSKSGLGSLWNSAKCLFGKGTAGELSKVDELEELYNSVSGDISAEAVSNLYTTVFGTEFDLDSQIAGCKTSKELMNGSYSIDGTEISKDDIVNALESQVSDLNDSFSDTVSSQGWISKGVSWLNNNIAGIGTTENMTQAQIDELENQVDKLKNASTAEEFASVYKSITGETLCDESLRSLSDSETSKLENTTAAETIIDYENTTENIKNTAIAVGVGVATAATGGLAGAVAVGVGATVAVNAIDAGTQNNGKNIGENLIEYAQTDLVKDACVGAVNGFTGKLGNMAGEKLVSSFAAKKLGTTAATELVENTMKQAAVQGLSTAAQESAANAALKGSLSAGTRVLTEFADGAIDAGLSSGAEYIIDAAAGENGNFTNADGKLFNDDGSLAFVDNFTKNFDAKDMAEQVVISTLMGGAMSAGMQEGMGLVSKGVDSIKNYNLNTNIKEAEKSGLFTSEEIGTLKNILRKDGDSLYSIELTPEKYDMINRIQFGERLDTELADEISNIGKQYGTEIHLDNNIVSDSYAYKHRIFNQGAQLNSEYVEALESALKQMDQTGQAIPQNIYLTSLFDENAKVYDAASNTYKPIGKAAGVFAPINADAIFLNTTVSTYPDYFKGTIYHEAAHQRDFGLMNASGFSAFYSDQTNINITSDFDNGFIKGSDIAYLISDYSTNNNHEFVAEVTQLLTSTRIAKDSVSNSYVINPRFVQNGYYINASGQPIDINTINTKTLNQIMRVYDQITWGNIGHAVYIS